VAFSVFFPWLQAGVNELIARAAAGAKR